MCPSALSLSGDISIEDYAFGEAGHASHCASGAAATRIRQARLGCALDAFLGGARGDGRLHGVAGAIQVDLSTNLVHSKDYQLDLVMRGPTCYGTRHDEVGQARQSKPGLVVLEPLLRSSGGHKLRRDSVRAPRQVAGGDALPVRVGVLNSEHQRGSPVPP
jgi:hypothetical protein